jgi:hypothetical protein
MMLNLSIKSVNNKDQVTGFYISSQSSKVPGLSELVLPVFSLDEDGDVDLSLIIVDKSLVRHLLINGILVINEVTQNFLDGIFFQEIDIDFTLNIEPDVVIFVEKMLQPVATGQQDEGPVLQLVFQEEEDDDEQQRSCSKQDATTSEAGEEVDSFVPERGEVQIDLSLFTQAKKEKQGRPARKVKGVRPNRAKPKAVNLQEASLDELKKMALEKGASDSLVQVMSRQRLIDLINK